MKQVKDGEIQKVALYRKYRPSTFDEVRNQDHIISVLKGAIEKGDIPHALLFSGSRGTGKTTLARIFAKGIGASEMDIYEIDGASNRGIDDIRALRDAVHTLPYESERKVYIIDEVHMLTKDAFSAFLKTLEEPPAHVVFVLATTEEDKLMDTILSRCQVFRFRAPSREVLKDTVIDISKKEGFVLTKDAADLIAVAAGGSFRDAIGITQKVILASRDNKGDADEVADIIGAPKHTVLQTILEGLHEKDTEKALVALRETADMHVDMKLFVNLLLERLRTIILLRNAPSQEAVLLSALHEDAQKQVKDYAEDKKSPINSHMLLRFLEVAEQVGKMQLTHLPIELAIIEVCTKEK